MLTIFMSALKTKIFSIVNRVRLELWFEENYGWWLEKNRPKCRFGSVSEVALNRAILKERFRIELEEGKDYQEELARLRREIAAMVQKSGICKARI